MFASAGLFSGAAATTERDLDEAFKKSVHRSRSGIDGPIFLIASSESLSVR